MREMVLPVDETKIFNELLVTRLEDINQQIKKWLTRWKPVIDHSMKQVEEVAQKNSKLIWNILRQTNQRRQESQGNYQQENTNGKQEWQITHWQTYTQECIRNDHRAEQEKQRQEDTRRPILYLRCIQNWGRRNPQVGIRQ
jgi:hypothetical protein